MRIENNDTKFDKWEEAFRGILPGVLPNDVIPYIVGEHKYVIDDWGYNMEGGIVWVLVVFLEGSVLNMGTVQLQFGKDPGIVAMETLDKYPKNLPFEELAGAAEDNLDETDLIFDLDRGDSVSLIDEDEYLSIELQINWNHPLNLPNVAMIDKMMRKIKDMIFDPKSLEVS